MWVGKKGVLNLISWGRIIPKFPLAGSNVGSLYGIRAAPMAATQVDKAQVPSKGQGVENQKDLTNIGFRVKLKEMPMIQDYVNRIYNQFVADPNTKEQRTCDQTCNFFIYDSI